MILIDTSLIVWLLEGHDRLGSRARATIDAQAPTYYSSMSIFELAIKSMRGRIAMPADLPSILDDVGLRQLPFVAEDAVNLAEFRELVGHDPFDRALVAQAAGEGLTFLTADRRLLALGRSWIVDATV